MKKVVIVAAIVIAVAFSFGCTSNSNSDSGMAKNTAPTFNLTAGKDIAVSCKMEASGLGFIMTLRFTNNGKEPVRFDRIHTMVLDENQRQTTPVFLGKDTKKTIASGKTATFTLHDGGIDEIERMDKNGRYYYVSLIRNNKGNEETILLTKAPIVGIPDSQELSFTDNPDNAPV